jgi:short-chain fatty acids transporter
MAERASDGVTSGAPTGVAFDEQTDAPPVTPAEQQPTPAERMERSAALTWLTVLAGGGYIIWQFATQGFLLDLNFVNFILLMLGLVAYRTPMAYVEAIDEGIRACGQIVLQFPFYAGIMGMMASSGLVVIFANVLVSLSNDFTFPLAAMVSAGIVNLAVPSAGGQWAVQGPLLVEAAQGIDVSMGRTIIAFGYGDQLTNALQPMWMLPLLGVTQLKARDILGYTAVAMLAIGTIYAVCITVLPWAFG